MNWQSIEHLCLPFKIQKATLPRPSYCKKGSWSTNQTRRFLIFIDYFCKLFDGTYNKRPLKPFNFMSQFVKTRNTKQCRSHLQKILNNGQKPLKKVLKHFWKQMSQKQIDIWSQIYQSQLLQIESRIFDGPEKELKTVYSSARYKIINEVKIQQLDPVNKKTYPSAQKQKQQSNKKIKRQELTIIQKQEQKMNISQANGLQELQGEEIKCSKSNSKFCDSKDNIVRQCMFYLAKWLQIVLKLQSKVNSSNIY